MAIGRVCGVVIKEEIMVKELEVGTLVEKQDIYPRNQRDWLTSLKYADAMKAGAKFPAITVAFDNDGQPTIIDGWHRTEASRITW